MTSVMPLDHTNTCLSSPKTTSPILEEILQKLTEDKDNFAEISVAKYSACGIFHDFIGTSSKILFMYEIHNLKIKYYYYWWQFLIKHSYLGIITVFTFSTSS